MTNVPQINTTFGLDSAIREVAGQVPIFIPSLLIFIYLVIFITGYKKQSETSNTGGDVAQWATIAGVVTSIVALILSLGVDIINMPTLVTTISVTILSAIWFLSSGNRGGD